MARPSKFSEKTLEFICDRLSQGIPLTVICEEPGMPAARTVYDWCDHPDHGKRVSTQIARARLVGYDKLAWDCLVISDTPQEGVEVSETRGANGDSTTTKRGDMTAHRKLQVWTRLQLLARFAPQPVQVRLADADGSPVIDPVTKLLGEIASNGRPKPGLAD